MENQENKENKEDKGFDVVKLAACIFVGFVATNVVAGVGQAIATTLEERDRRKRLEAARKLEYERLQKAYAESLNDPHNMSLAKKAQQEAEQTSNDDNNDNNTSKK